MMEKTFQPVMPSFNIEIPKSIVRALKIPQSNVICRLKEELSLHLYSEGYLSFGKARELSGLSKWGFSELLGQKKIERHYSFENLCEDIQFVNEQQQSDSHQ